MNNRVIFASSFPTQDLGPRLRCAMSCTLVFLHRLFCYVRALSPHRNDEGHDAKSFKVPTKNTSINGCSTVLLALASEMNTVVTVVLIGFTCPAIPVKNKNFCFPHVGIVPHNGTIAGFLLLFSDFSYGFILCCLAGTLYPQHAGPLAHCFLAGASRF